MMNKLADPTRPIRPLIIEYGSDEKIPGDVRPKNEKTIKLMMKA
jgi:hypothetical protein